MCSATSTFPVGHLNQKKMAAHPKSEWVLAPCIVSAFSFSPHVDFRPRGAVPFPHFGPSSIGGSSAYPDESRPQPRGGTDSTSTLGSRFRGMGGWFTSDRPFSRETVPLYTEVQLSVLRDLPLLRTKNSRNSSFNIFYHPPASAGPLVLYGGGTSRR